MARAAARQAILEAAQAHPVTLTLASIAVLALMLQLVLGLLVAPNNWDSMTYHLARAAFWAEYSSVGNFPNGTAWQLAYPPNGEILQAWTLVMADGDRLAALVQWLSLLGTAACVYCGVRFLGFGRPTGIWVAALFVLLPQPILQATTTQNDLITTFFLSAAALFLVRGLRDTHPGELGVGAIAFGLGIDAKGTALLALPSLALLVGVALYTYRPPGSTVRGAVLLTVLGFVAFGSFKYVQNVVVFGDPIGPAKEGNERDAAVYPSLVRTTWNFVETPG